MAEWITSISTLALVFATGVLAYITWLLAKITREPFVIATIEPSPWAMIYVDMHLVNEGTATAFDVSVSFTPSLEGDDPSMPVKSFQKVSAIRKDQRLSTNLGGYKIVDKKVFEVEVSWASKPGGKRRTLKYNLDMKWLDDLRQLGGDPRYKVAEDMKKIREQIDRLVNGSRHLQVDSYSTADRQREEAAPRARWEEEAQTD